MRFRSLIATMLIGAVVLSGASRKKNVIYAQSVPYTATHTWNPNPASENVVSYTVQLDGATPVVVLASACTPTQCSTTISVPTFGAHTITDFATNQTLTGDPGVIGTPQNGPTASLNFSLNQKPGAVSGRGIR